MAPAWAVLKARPGCRGQRADLVVGEHRDLGRVQRRRPAWWSRCSDRRRAQTRDLGARLSLVSDTASIGWRVEDRSLSCVVVRPCDLGGGEGLDLRAREVVQRGRGERPRAASPSAHWPGWWRRPGSRSTSACRSGRPTGSAICEVANVADLGVVVRLADRRGGQAGSCAVVALVDVHRRRGWRPTAN